MTVFTVPAVVTYGIVENVSTTLLSCVRHDGFTVLLIRNDKRQSFEIVLRGTSGTTSAGSFPELRQALDAVTKIFAEC